MSKLILPRRAFLGALASAGILGGLNQGCSADAPVPAPAAHPLDPALDIARDRLKYMRDNVIDYTCYMMKRERINGKAYDPETALLKVRNRKTVDNKLKTPLSVYMYFVKPESIKGREVAYVENKNDGKLLAREAGIAGKLAGVLALAPNGTLAMRGNRYPITEIGLENLIVKLIERGERERKHAECVVEFRKDAKINDRKCTVIEVIHPTRRNFFEFNLAQIFLDDELQVPIRYAAYDWPKGKDEETKPKPSPENVLEEYTYLDLKLNVGLKDEDFVVK